MNYQLNSDVNASKLLLSQPALRNGPGSIIRLSREYSDFVRIPWGRSHKTILEIIVLLLIS